MYSNCCQSRQWSTRIDYVAHPVVGEIDSFDGYVDLVPTCKVFARQGAALKRSLDFKMLETVSDEPVKFLYKNIDNKQNSKSQSEHTENMNIVDNEPISNESVRVEKMEIDSEQLQSQPEQLQSKFMHIFEENIEVDQSLHMTAHSF